LDGPEVLQYIFYPRRDIRPGPENSQDYFIPVENDISLSCRFYSHSPSSPTIMFFHGNGEVLSEYDDIAPVYSKIGTNFLVVDYRGYGASGGTPTFSNLISDSHRIFKAFLDIKRKGGLSGRIWVMGRSLGSTSAIELAASYPEEISGLIIESGFGSIARLIRYLGIHYDLPSNINPAFPNEAKMSSIVVPTLILHGESDTLIPVEEARKLYNNASAERKKLVIINGANHNNIMVVDINKYFGTIRDFLSGE
jgi:alpha-beta hydrolase superfamily lysophospholipase